MSCTSPSSNPRNKPSVKKRRSHKAPSFFAKASPYWGFHPPFSFGLAQKKTGRGRSKRKNVIPGSCESVQQRLTVFCRVRRTRYHSRWFFPTCRTLAVNGVQPPDGRYCSFRCRWPGVPGQRAAKRNARKEKLVTSNQHPQIRHAGAGVRRTWQKPSGPHGQRLRRPPYLPHGLCHGANTGVFSSTGRGAFSFSKENGGRSSPGTSL